MVYLSEVVVEFGLWGEHTLLAVSAQAFAVISVLQLPWGLNRIKSTAVSAHAIAVISVL